MVLNTGHHDNSLHFQWTGGIKRKGRVYPVQSIPSALTFARNYDLEHQNKAPWKNKKDKKTSQSPSPMYIFLPP
jgi:hypothetical protein